VANTKQPFAIRILTWFAALASIGMYLSILLAIYDIGPHIMGGERVTRTEWLHIAAPLVATMGILMALVCYALATRKRWSRHVVIAMFTLIIVYATILGTLNLLRHSIMWRALINATVFGCISCWYFYLKPNVVQYFRTLKAASKL
jgi:FtsH-binding integral membrane protein